jgi:hypothetical protein
MAETPTAFRLVAPNFVTLHLPKERTLFPGDITTALRAAMGIEGLTYAELAGLAPARRSPGRLCVV